MHPETGTDEHQIHASLGGPLKRRSAPYSISGEFYEACDCFAVCPCWTGSTPDEDTCTSVFVWAIERGTIDGTDVSGRRVACVSNHAARREQLHQGMLMFVDEQATQEQTTRLAEALTGYLGGPLRDLARITGELLDVEHAEIRIERDGRRTKLSVGRRILVSGSAKTRSDGRVTVLQDAFLSDVLGSPAEVCVTDRFKVGFPGRGMDIDLRGRSLMRGAFAYEHAPANPA